MGRVAVFGDIGGHAKQMLSALVDLGMDPDTLTLPDDLTVVQVGDLIHRGPNSHEVLAVVQHMLTHQPDQWVQLAGNHEALYLPGTPRFQWGESLAEDDARLLGDWWTAGAMQIAAGLATAHGDLLVTHAGLTAGLWVKTGEPRDVRDTVAILNALPDSHPDAVWRTGRMLGGGDPELFAGPVWAEAGGEVYPSWMLMEADGRGIPFGQVHGHSSAYHWDRSKWRCGPAVAARFTPLSRHRHLHGVIGSRAFFGIDPEFGRSVRGSWQPLVFDQARVVAR